MRSPIRTAKFAFAGGDAQAPTMLVELRGDGCQTMVPPSVHPCGERLAWERAGVPARVDEGTRRLAGGGDRPLCGGGAGGAG